MYRIHNYPQTTKQFLITEQSTELSAEFQITLQTTEQFLIIQKSTEQFLITQQSPELSAEFQMTTNELCIEIAITL